MALKKHLSLILALVLGVFGLSACGGNEPDFTVTYDVVDTRYNQYFVLKSDQLLTNLNSSLSEYNLLLSVLPHSEEDMSTMYTDDGDTWKIIVGLKPPPSIPARTPSNTEDWTGYVKEVKLSLYSDGEEMSKQNGQYIRVLINTFTPGAEETVENALGIYGKPDPQAKISDGIYRATMGNVCYEYRPSQNRFFVRPLDEKLHAEVTAPKQTQNVIRPD